MFIPHEFARSVWRLSDEDAGRLLKACFDYVEGFTEAEVAESIKSIWAEFKTSFEEEARRYEAKCAKYRRNATKRWNANDAMAMQLQCNGIQESERETERDEEKRSKKEEDKEKGKDKEPNKKSDKKNHAEKKETNKQAELFEPEAPTEAAKVEAKPRFTKPSLAEVAEYVRKKGYERWVDAEAFWSYHENRDWRVGNHKMKNWHLAITTWMRQSKCRQQQKQRPTGNSMAERAYRMVHFELENNPEGWIEEERKWEEFKKEHGL